MNKKSVIALFCLSLVAVSVWSWAATVWQLQTKLNNVGGTIKVRDNATQTVVGTVVYSNFTTAAPVPVSVAASTGYKISALTRGGSSLVIGNYTTHYSTTFLKSAGASQSLVASFAAKLVPVTGSVVGAGTISPTSTSVVYGGTVVLSSSPASANNFLTGVTGGTVTDLIGNPVVLPYAASVKITASNVIAPRSVTATYAYHSADAGESQTGMVQTQITLNGQIVGGGSPSWSQLSGPAVVLSGATTLTPSFTPASAGTYSFRLVELVGGRALVSADTQVVVVDSLADSMRSNCNGCHSATGVSPAPLAFTRWSSSRHKTLGVSCVSCHSNGAMPTPVNVNTVDAATFVVTNASAGTVGAYYCAACHSQSTMTAYDGSLHKINGVKCSSCHTQGPHNPAANSTACQGCHLDGSGNVALHPVEIGTSACTLCHNPHSTYSALPETLEKLHYNNMTSGTYPASYMTSKAGCTDCHFNNAANRSIRQDWYTSGHARVNAAAWSGEDFKTKSGCVQCHSTTGFIAYSTGRATAAWGVASDKTKELLTCKGCHSNVGTGALRTVAPISPFANDSYRNPEAGKSNLCMDCHSGTNSGTGITYQLEAVQADFSNLAFIAPHSLSAGGTLFAKSGYHFPGRSYNSVATHSNLGSSDGAGPCVTCHKNSSFGHSFRTGAIPLCATCHGAALPAAELDADKAGFSSVLEVLRAQLAAKGLLYTPVAPYFANRNWGAGQAGANTLGAAFNYVLMLSDPGAFAHNPQYARQLILDSIDYLDNGQFDDSVVNLAVPTLRDSGAITQAVADSLIGLKAKNLCTTCHGGTSATANPMSSKAHPTHLGQAWGPGFYLGSELSACQVCHFYNAALHLNGSVDLATGAGSACQGCHAGAAPLWNSTARLECTVCHAANPATLPNGVAAPFKGNFASTGHGQYAASNQCTVCHDPDSSHISGSLGSYTRLRVLNDNNLCASCHSSETVRSAFRNMSTHVDREGRALSCRDCHDPHGTSNLSMIRSQINGSSIVYTDPVNGLVDPVGNRGLCQVCHTLTNHYQAGVPETNHYTSGCLNCHTHNSAGGAFKPIGGSCDSCHGYPPSPRNATGGFGPLGWESSRFEDYSGGGGAHLVAAHITPSAKPSEGWTNCTVCHNGGATGSSPNHQAVTPVKSHIDRVTISVDPRLRFSEGFTVYTGARLSNPPALNVTGSCFNIACHMSPSPRWSTER